LAGRRGEALAGFADALRRWRDLGLVYEAALCTTSMVKLLGPSVPETRAAAEVARTGLQRREARPLLAELDAALAQPAPEVPARSGRGAAQERVSERS
jgi:hypothetical protein